MPRMPSLRRTIAHEAPWTRRQRQSYVSHEGPWIRRQRQILVSLAVFVGCALIVTIPWDGIAILTRGDSSAGKESLVSRMRERISRQRKSHRLRPKQNNTNTSPFHSDFDVVSIPVNPIASLHDDIISIEHLPALNRIDIRLRHGARCPRPYLMGRMSGPVLVMLQDWVWSPIRNLRDNTKTTLITGYYQVPVSGQYHLEVIALYCRDSLQNMREKSNRKSRSNGTAAWDENIEKALVLTSFCAR